MAGETIRGLTIEVSANATEFNKSMAAVRKDAKSSQKELDALQKSLELEYDPTTLERAQQVAQDAIDNTAEQAEVLRKRLEHLEKTGKADTSHYRQIKAELAQTELQVKKLQKEQEKLNNLSLDRAAKTVKETRDELEELKKSLNVKFDSEKFARAQEVVQNAIKASEEEARLLEERLKALEESGQVDTEEYKRLQDELKRCKEETKEFRDEAENLNNLELKKFGDSIKDVGSKITSVGKALTPLSVGATATLTGLGAIGKKAISTADEVATLATQYDISSDALQRFNYIALQTDTDSEVLYKSFVKMRAAAADIATGGASVAATALQKLNLDIKSFDGSEEQFLSILTALADMEDQTQMVAIANDIFGERIANNLLPLIYAGSGAIKEYAAEYETLGSLSEDQVSDLAEFDNVLNRTKTELENVSLQMGYALLPIMQILADFVRNEVTPRLQELTDWFSNLSPEMQGVILMFLALIAIAAPLLIIIGQVARGVGSLITLFKMLKAEQWQAVLGFMALFAAAGLALDLFHNWKDMSWVEKLLKTLALAALIAAGAIAVFHASWSLGLAIGGITAGVAAAIAAINSARQEYLPEEEEFSTSDFGVSGAGFDEEAFNKKYGIETPNSEDENSEDDSSNEDDFSNEDYPGSDDPYNVYDTIGAGGTTGDIYNNDYSTNTTTQNVTVVIENYADEVDVDDLVHQINIKLAEAM